MAHEPDRHPLRRAVFFWSNLRKLGWHANPTATRCGALHWPMASFVRLALVFATLAGGWLSFWSNRATALLAHESDRHPLRRATLARG
ncbi:MAG: hypothetical protein AAFQ45_14365, partial [Pseudomonadota bacterium]